MIRWYFDLFCLFPDASIPYESIYAKIKFQGSFQVLKNIIHLFSAFAVVYILDEHIFVAYTSFVDLMRSSDMSAIFFKVIYWNSIWFTKS